MPFGAHLAADVQAAPAGSTSVVMQDGGTQTSLLRTSSVSERDAVDQEYMS